MLWKWKLARSAEDVLHLLNGDTKHDHPVPDARLCMTWRGDHPRFWVFATKAARRPERHDGLGGWGQKKATQADDVMEFLNGAGPYPAPVRHMQIAATWVGDHHEFHVFYRDPAPGQEPPPATGGWGWKLATTADDALQFLNGTGLYEHPVTAARIATAHRDHHDEHFIFYQRSTDMDPIEDWRWQSVATEDEVRGAVDAKGGPPLDFQVAAPSADLGSFQVFTHPADQVVDLTAATGAEVSGA